MQKPQPTLTQKARAHLDFSNYAVAVKGSILIAAALVLYLQDLEIIFNDALQSEATSYMLAIPFLLAYFVYRKRKMICAVATQESSETPKHARLLTTLVGILLCATAMTLYWYGSYTFTPLEYHILTLPIFTAGLVLIIFNPRVLRESIFPICFLAFLIPPPAEILYSIGTSLSVIGSQASSTVVSALGVSSKIIDQYGNPTILITRPDNSMLGFSLDLACSGIYPIMGFLVFAALTAYIIRDKPWKKASLFFLGVPLIYLLNIIRIITILLIGYQYGEELALQIFHLLGGIVLLALGTGLLLVISDKVFKTRLFTRAQRTSGCSTCQVTENTNENYCSNCGRLLNYGRTKLRKGDVVKVIAIVATLILLVSIQAPTFALTEGPAQIIIQTPAGEQGNTQILPEIHGYALEFTYRDTAFEQLAKQDASLLYCYSSKNPTGKDVWVDVEIASTRSSLHRWEYCLVTYPQEYGHSPEAQQLDLRDVQLLENPPLIARYFGFQNVKNNQTQLVLYWYESSIFIVNKTAQQKQVKISVISLLADPQDMAKAKEDLLPFAVTIANYWQPIKMWTRIALTISQNGLTLAGTSMTMIIIVAIFYTAERMRFRKAKTKTYRKLEKAEQKIIDAVQEAKTTSIPTFQNISTAYQETTGQGIKAEILDQKLTQARKNGLIGIHIVNQKDEPVQTWKANVTRREATMEKLKKLANIFRIHISR